MTRLLVATLFSFVLYLALTTGTGTIGLWSIEELLFGVVFAVVAALLTKNVLRDNCLGFLNPRFWLLLTVYLCGPFFWELAKANIDVVYRVITGRINPGIVRIAPGLTNDASVTLLANSITLTPGTLTVEVDDKTNNLYVHWINVDEKALAQSPRDCAAVCGVFPEWARRIAE
ncbi:MAG: Na+/H+ antiporter subunit E [Dehalococcoidia bacterium]|nr:Na+/H+ antiporter subunit E [Dehalococcoidia bacterium]